MRIGDAGRMEINRLTVHPATVARLLAGLTILLVGLSLGGQLFRYVTGHDHVFGLLRIFNLDLESNIPALFSVVLLLLASFLLAIIALLEKKRAGTDVLQWALLSAGFGLMAIDESVSIHELFITPVRAWLGGQNLGIFYFAWVLPAIALVLVLGAYFLPFLFRLPAATRYAFVAAAVVYLGGAIGVELIEGQFRERQGNQNLTYNLIVSIEEGLEMTGVILFIYALLSYLADYHGELHFNIAKGKPHRRTSKGRPISAGDPR